MNSMISRRAVLRNYGAAVLENRDRLRVPTPVQNMFEHVHVGAGWNRLGQIRRQQLAPGGDLFVREARLRCLHAGLEIDEHTSKMGMEFQHGENQCAPATAKIGDHVRARKVPRPRDGSVIFCGSRAHDGTKDRAQLQDPVTSEKVHSDHAPVRQACRFGCNR